MSMDLERRDLLRLGAATAGAGAPATGGGAPDHVPDHPDDAGGRQACAQGDGSILGAIKAAEHRQRGRQ